VVGVGDKGYNMIVDSFRSDKMGTFARVIVVNPLHVKLPRLVLSLSCTYNCFDSEWVKEQWKRIEELWQVECECAIGPIIGHSSDGDLRRRQLMLSGYTCADGQRYGISWPGWVMSGTVIASGQVQGLHDQDFIHNGKKLINPLDSPVRVLQLGGDICCLEHLGMVYNKFSYDEHGLRLEDI
jgi:hypothetical protein